MDMSGMMGVFEVIGAWVVDREKGCMNTMSVTREHLKLVDDTSERTP
jgi:hypothetical protein